jgi:hypothetical protein
MLIIPVEIDSQKRSLTRCWICRLLRGAQGSDVGGSYKITTKKLYRRFKGVNGYFCTGTIHVQSYKVFDVTRAVEGARKDGKLSDAFHKFRASHPCRLPFMAGGPGRDLHVRRGALGSRRQTTIRRRPAEPSLSSQDPGRLGGVSMLSLVFLGELAFP